MKLASLLFHLMSISPIFFLMGIWTVAQLMIHALFEKKYPAHDFHGFKSVVVAHDIYRSISCGVFFICGLFIWERCVKSGLYGALEYQQLLLLNTSWYYMIFDLMFAVASQHIAPFRYDLLTHHLIALFYIALCSFYQLEYAWSLVCVTELLSVWTGLGSYSVYMEHQNLRKFCYFARMLTIVMWRIPWWLTAVTYLNIFNHFIIKGLMLLGITVILGMDFIWLEKCIKGFRR